MDRTYFRDGTSDVPDIRQMKQGRIPDIRLLIIAGYRISGIGFTGYPALNYRISGSKMPDI